MRSERAYALGSPLPPMGTSLMEWLSFREYSRRQATRKLSPDHLTVIGPSAHALPTWVSLCELAHQEDHTCGSEEEPRVNRTAEGNAGYEPRLREAIQEEVAQTEQSCASSGNRRQSIDDPSTVPEQRRAPAAQGADGQWAN